MKTTYIDVMRHGEPEGGDVLRGRTDHALTEKGWRQAETRIQTVPESQWDVVISSPLSRCSAFAESLSQQHNIEYKQVPEWREIDYGDWENQPTKMVWKQHASHVQKMWSDPMAFCAPNGEAVKDFAERIMAAWQTILTQHQGQRVLVVCHGGVMRILLQHLLHMHPKAMSRFRIPFAALSQFVVDHDEQDQHWVSLINHHGNEL